MSQKTSSVGRPALVVIRTRPDGTSTRHSVSHAAAPDQAALAAAVDADPVLHAVRRGEIVEVTVDEEIARPVEVLAMLRPLGGRDPEDPRSWSDGVVEEWERPDVEGQNFTFGSGAVTRWVGVNGQRATGLLCGAPGRSRLHLVLLSTDEDTGGSSVVPLSRVAAHSYVDNGTSMISGSGGKSLVLVAPSVAVKSVYGDYSGSTKVLPWPPTVQARAELIARWIEEEQLEVPAALAMATLNTTVLSASDAERWEELLGSVGVSFWIEGSGKLIDAIHTTLDQPESSFRSVREAMTAPNGDRGRALASCLEDVTDGARALTELLYGDWSTPSAAAVEQTSGHDTTWPHYARYMEELRSRGVR